MRSRRLWRSLDRGQKTLVADVQALSTYQTVVCLADLRWGDGYACASCGKGGPFKFNTRGTFYCSCGKHFSVTAGTVFDHHKISLNDCLVMIAVFEVKPHVKPVELAQLFGLSYDRALEWHSRMLAIERLDFCPMSPEARLFGINWWAKEWRIATNGALEGLYYRTNKWRRVVDGSEKDLRASDRSPIGRYQPISAGTQPKRLGQPP